MEVILDRSQRTSRYSSVRFFESSGIPTFMDAAHAIAHNKVMIIDGTTVITGSFNFSRSAEEKDAENMVIVKSEQMARLYRDNWNRHKEHSDSLAPRY